MTREQAELATAAGHSWAERKVEALDGEIPAIDWEDVWLAEWAEPLPFDAREVDDRDRPGLLAIANHAAAERWGELVTRHRTEEDYEDEEQDEEAEAEKLLEAVQNDLPRGIVADRDGARVYLRDEAGMERTITSLQHAWLAIAEWEEQGSL
jgi:hypothetical protein